MKHHPDPLDESNLLPGKDSYDNNCDYDNVNRTEYGDSIANGENDMEEEDKLQIKENLPDVTLNEYNSNTRRRTVATKSQTCDERPVVTENAVAKMLQKKTSNRINVLTCAHEDSLKGKSHLWTLHPLCGDMFQDGSLLRRRLKFKSCKKI